MKNIIVVDTTLLYANNSIEYALSNIDGKKPFEILLNKLKYTNIETIILLPNAESEIIKEISSISNNIGVDSYKSKIEVTNNQTLLTSLYLLAEDKKINNIILIYGDSPFIDLKELDELLKLHIEGIAEYTFGDNYAEGLVPEILSLEFLKKIKDYPYKKPDIESRKVFDSIDADINKFFIEVKIAEKDFSLKRLNITASSKRNFQFIKNLKRFIDWNAKYTEFFDTIKTHPEVLHIFPKYVEIEITNRCNLNCIFCPRTKLKRNIVDMDIDIFKKAIDELTAEYDDIIVSLSLMGEPLLHPKFLEFVDYAMNSNIFNLIVETNGTLLNDVIISKLSSYPANKLTILFGIDAFENSTYSTLRKSNKNYFDIVKSNIEKFLQYNETNRLRTFIQIVKMEENKSEIEQFYKYWEKFTPNIVIQKYNNYSGLLEKKDFTDLTPIERFPCWHLQRDLEIFSNGEVPLCKQDINAKFSIGNIKNESILTIWEKMKNYYMSNYKSQFDKIPICKECDEWYTFNF